MWWQLGWITIYSAYQQNTSLFHFLLYYCNNCSNVFAIVRTVSFLSCILTDDNYRLGRVTGESSLSRDTQTSLSPNISSSSSRRFPRHFQAGRVTVTPACPGYFLPAGHARNSIWGRHLGGIWYRGFTPSISRLTELLSLARSELPADVSYKSVDLFFTIVCTVTKKLPWTLCSSCQDLLYNSTNHFWAFLLFSVSLICFASVSTIASFSSFAL